ncbi:MAG TPA: hypothetical protein VK466_18110 [Terriglobales bacterium]|nr:hypothetical protein [Terriglobales bacterium]
MARGYYVLAFVVPILIGYLAHLERTSDQGPFDPKFIVACVVTAVVVVGITKLFPAHVNKSPSEKE